MTDIELVRLLVGATPTSPFYEVITDDEIQALLGLKNGDILQAAKYAAHSLSLNLAGWNTRERTGDIEVWNTLATQYLKALQEFLTSTSEAIIPVGMKPYFGGVSKADIAANVANTDNQRSVFALISICDDEE